MSGADDGVASWPATDVKNRWADAMYAVEVDDAVLEVTNHGRPRAVIISVRRWKLLTDALAEQALKRGKAQQ